MTILVSNEPDLLILFPTFDISGQWRYWSLTRYVICYQNFCYKERISENDISGWWGTTNDISGHQKWHIWSFTWNQKWHIWSLTNFVICYQNLCYKEIISENDIYGWWGTTNDISGCSLETRNDISCCSLATINDISGRSLATRNDISGRSIATRNHISGHSVVGGGGLMVPCVFL